MTAAEKMKTEKTSVQNPTMPVAPIAQHLITMADTDETFAALVMQEHKTLTKCINHVDKEVKKRVTGSGWIPDQEVFQMAIDYYQLDDVALEQKAMEEERKRKEEAEKKAEEEKARKEAERQQKAIERQEEEKKKKEEDLKKEGQLSLFEVMGG